MKFGERDRKSRELIVVRRIRLKTHDDLFLTGEIDSINRGETSYHKEVKPSRKKIKGDKRPEEGKVSCKGLCGDPSECN